MSDRIEINAPVIPYPIRLAVCAWMKRHGVDPNYVALPGWIERQPDLYRLAWEGYIPDVEDVVKMNDDRTDALRVPCFAQLEGPPLPWPPELLTWVGEHDRTAA